MGKKLSEMTLEELWELFPIFLTEHNNKWKDYYAEMEGFLKKKLIDFEIARISHIGSTAIHNIWAKAIVDILVEIEQNVNIEMAGKAIEKIGFIRMTTTENRVSLNWGYTEDGFAEKVFHLHLRYAGDNDELYFRDYLNDYPKFAKEYEQMKLDLCKRYEHDRDGYTNAKTEFIKKYTSDAKNVYTNRY